MQSGFMIEYSFILDYLVKINGKNLNINCAHSLDDLHVPVQLYNTIIMLNLDEQRKIIM